MTGRRAFWPLRDLPALGWLVAVVGVVLVHPFVPAPRWLMIHLLLLGAVSHSILVWSRHFADAVLHTPPPPTDRRDQTARLLMHNLGVVVVVAGILTGAWMVTVVGAASVALAVLGHGAALVRQIRRALPSRFGPTIRYYVAAALMLPLGAVLGALLARGLGDPLHEQVLLAHVSLNVLGWMGLTIVGTLVTLWPTMLRTRIAPGAERAAARALPVLVGSVLLTAGGALIGQRPVVALGLAGYLAGIAVVAAPFAVTARQKPPSGYPTWSVLAGLVWLVGCLTALMVGIATAPSWAVVSGRFHAVTPFLAAGFAAQVLLGALSYLVPMAKGGGPSVVRAGNAVIGRAGLLRVVTANAALLVCALPVPTAVRVLCSLLVLVSLAAFVPLLVLALRAGRRARAVPPPGRVPRRSAASAVAGLAAVVLAAAAGVAVDPAAAGIGTSAAAAGVTPTGRTTTVQVEARGMRFSPSTITVPAGDRLVIELTNRDGSDVHDLVLESGQRSGRLRPGASARIDVGPVGRDLSGWCSVTGHRQMGMVLKVDVAGGPADPHAGHAHASKPAPSAPAEHGHATPDADFTPYDAVLPPLTSERLHRRTFTVRETVREVAPGVTQQLWTYNGTAPGPVLHGRVGDVFEITLVNDAEMGHSIDFHAGALAPDRPTRTIAPGQRLTYRFTATRAGIWMYHCSTMPMSAHIANGMFGAVVIEPEGLPPVDRSYLLVQSELYFGAQGQPVDVDKLQAERPDAVVFNGYANQYDAHPLAAAVGERVRLWVLDAGPSRSTSIHVVGAQFDTTYLEGAYQLRRGEGGSQALALAPAQGGFVELSFPQPGHYPVVSHVMVDAERGAHGIFAVTPP